MENVKVSQKGREAVISLNPKVYSLEVVYSAAYTLMDKAYFFLDGDPEKEIKALMRARNEKAGKKELESLAMEFGNELINYSVYIAQAARNQAVREAIIKRALATQLSGEYSAEYTGKPALKEAADEIKMPEEDEDLYVKDPKGISQPWTPEKAKDLKKPG